MNLQNISISVRKYGIAAVLIIVVIASAMRVVSAQPIVNETVDLPTVKLLTVASLESTEHIVATGTIESEDQVTIMSEVSAPVETVFARVGESVAPGTPILQFKSDDYNAQVAQAAAGVQGIQAQISLQTAAPREEDLRRAELAVVQAEAGLQTAITNREKTVIANTDLVEDAQISTEQLYRDAYFTARSASSALSDALALVSDYQQLYFNCLNESTCFTILNAKEAAIYEAYGIRYAGQWSSSAVQSIRSGIIADLATMDESSPDGVLTESILIRAQNALVLTREALVAIRQGFDSSPTAVEATSIDRATVEGKRAAVDAVISTIEATLNTYERVQGGVRGGEAASIEEARTTAEQNMRVAEANVAIAQATLETTQLTLRMLIEGPRPLDLGPLYAQLAQANAAYDAANASQRRYFISAPFAGEIIALDAKPGELFSPGRAIVTLANPGALEISVFISAEDRRAISRHASVRVNDSTEGVITAIGTGIDPQTGKVEVRVAIVNNTDALLVGESVTVTFEKESLGTEGVQVPLSAVKTTPEGSYVFSIGEGDVLIPHKIMTGSIESDRIWVNFDGTAPEFIIENARGLRAGDSVKRPS